MSEYKLTDSILNTPVTWGELEEHLSASLKTQAKFGEKRAVVDIGDGTGFASLCGLITCDWVGATADEKLPKKVIIKIPSILPMRRCNEALPKEERMFDGEEAWAKLEAQISEVHNIEIATYKFFSQFDHLTVPKMFYGYPFDKSSKINGQICMEFVDNSNMMNFTEAASIKQIKQITQALGKIQACSLVQEPTSHEFDKDMFGDFASTMPKEVYCSAFKPLINFDASPRMAKAIEEIEKILPDYYGANLPSTIHKQMKYRPVLVSGDVRTENVLINKDTGDLSGLIDWQCTHRGVGVEDLLRIQMFGQSAADRRATKDELIEELHKTIVENIDGAEPPYTLEQVRELYDLLFPHAGLFFAGTGPILMKTILSNPKLSDEERGKIFAVLLDKLLGILEDIVAYDKLNKNSPHKLEFRQKA